jgi:hypothetical protein
MINAKSPPELAAAQDATRAACARMPDRDTCAEKLRAAMAGTPVATRCALVEMLGTVGGNRALAAVSAAAGDTEPEIQDAAFRILGQWMGPEASPRLLELAKTASSAKLAFRALRGYIRIARQQDLPADAKLAMCREAIAAAQRDEEKKLALEVLVRVPSPESLALAVEQLRSPTLKVEASTVALAIGEKIAKSKPAEVRAAMRHVIEANADKASVERARELINGS